MKCILIAPPQYIPESPFLSTPILKGLLNNAGHNTEQIDLNLKFYNYILSPEYIKNSLDGLFADYEKNAEEIFNQYDKNKSFEEYPYDFQNKYLKYQRIKEINKEEAYQSVNLINGYVNTVKTGTALESRIARADIWSNLGYIFLPYFDKKVLNDKYFYNIKNSSQLNIFLDESKNIFYKFYEEEASQIVEKNPDFIGISLCYATQLLPALTLAKMLKEKTKAHINIGGTFFSYLREVLINKPEIFEQFVDSIIYEEGETPILELMKHLEGKINIEEVPNLIYLKNGKVQINEKSEKMSLNDVPTPDFSDLPMDSYYSPVKTIPLIAERGCYWAKCNFCNLCYTGSRYYFKNPEKLVEEIKELREKYDFSYISFVGEAMSPSYLRKLSNEIIKSGLNFKFITYTRIEREFDEELLALAKQAGAVELRWGFESVNERVLKAMNKTNFTDKKERLEIIKIAHKLGLKNSCCFMVGFPSETKEEAMETFNFIKDNQQYIDTCMYTRYVITNHSPIAQRPEDFFVYDMKPNEEFDLICSDFKISSGMSNEEIDNLHASCLQELFFDREEPFSNMNYIAVAAMFWGL